MKFNWYLFIWTYLFLAACSEDIHLPESANFIKLYGGEKPDYGVEVAQGDDGYIYVGSSFSHPDGGTGKDICVVKTNLRGDREWVKFYGGAGEDQAKSVKPAPDGGFLILGDWGETESVLNGTDYYLFKTNDNGEILWSKRYGLPSRYERAKSMNITQDGGIVIAGNIVHSEEESEVYLIKTDAAGEILWESQFGLLNLPNEVGNTIIPLYDGGFILCGTEKGRKLADSEDTDVRIIKINAEGSIILELRLWRANPTNRS